MFLHILKVNLKEGSNDVELHLCAYACILIPRPHMVCMQVKYVNAHFLKSTSHMMEILVRTQVGVMYMHPALP